MKKKTPAKAKAISKSKVKPAKKKEVKKSKPAAKKPAPKPVSKAKPVSKKTAPKSAHTKTPVAKKPSNKKKEQPVAKSKAAHKPEVKAPPIQVKKPVVDKNNKPKPPVQKEENKSSAPEKYTPPVNRPSVGRPMPVNRRPEPARAIISNSKPQEETGKNRYSDKELEEFREIINEKLANARKELATLQAQMTAANEHGTDDTASTFKILEDGSDSLAKEEAGQLASRQKKFIEQLENALVRIENKTYGICRVTGKLIPKERLRAVPHTTQSIEAKLNQYRE
jgi:RNA polymerase-binding transcription factor DksA